MHEDGLKPQNNARCHQTSFRDQSHSFTSHLLSWDPVVMQMNIAPAGKHVLVVRLSVIDPCRTSIHSIFRN